VPGGERHLPTEPGNPVRQGAELLRHHRHPPAALQRGRHLPRRRGKELRSLHVQRRRLYQHLQRGQSARLWHELHPRHPAVQRSVPERPEALSQQQPLHPPACVLPNLRGSLPDLPGRGRHLPAQHRSALRPERGLRRQHGRRAATVHERRTVRRAADRLWQLQVRLGQLQQPVSRRQPLRRRLRHGMRPHPALLLRKMSAQDRPGVRRGIGVPERCLRAPVRGRLSCEPGLWIVRLLRRADRLYRGDLLPDRRDLRHCRRLRLDPPYLFAPHLSLRRHPPPDLPMLRLGEGRPGTWPGAR
jgi:hypothetical protein